MPKVKNLQLAGLKVLISPETVLFDGEGIGEIKSEELYNRVLELNNYFPVEDEGTEEVVTTQDNVEETKEEEVKLVDEIPEDAEYEEDGYDIQDMTHSQLDSLAKELEVEDYPKKGNKDDKIEAIMEAKGE